MLTLENGAAAPAQPPHRGTWPRCACCARPWWPTACSRWSSAHLTAGGYGTGRPDPTSTWRSPTG
ncbi:hypothetical protein [Blastococcus brunescens]|uniref:Uncharacterized protein n=1 Tax=Blastococcus brunescens TaxID=1564165 RepID=A0ABZ1B7B0_9ACTN|nr:hypothetical protein [Blastococcus sp. BMG 8361]WRL66695.1 hypothetical protein U6N30_15675 [Blastococcus sp. BMG 8361]